MFAASWSRPNLPLGAGDWGPQEKVQAWSCIMSELHDTRLSVSKTGYSHADPRNLFGNDNGWTLIPPSPISTQDWFTEPTSHTLYKWSEITQSCLTLCDPVDCSPPGSSVHGILQARILEWVATSFFRGSSRPRDWTQVSHIAGRHFNLWATREAHTLYSLL